MPRKPKARPASSVVQSHDLSFLKSTDLVSFNSEAERKFCLLIVSLLGELGEVTPQTVYQEASFEINISITTAKRYFVKHTARKAMFGVDERGFVFAKF